ncbi:carboxymuconolactone decarboxylase family protein [Membranihabitans maritimus]|uniref:carboxymuconolactone decarboxylase family protein n=1 Tax=Membranihabitans maritimus TaxID=2904244 RepID=UPI001F3CBE4C|nr:carboxymuconolactone decarboxylase family protein [Membranihabitans maritimus]
MKFHSLLWTFFLPITLSINTMNGQTIKTIGPKDQGIILISALTATGDLDNLKLQLNTALDSGLTINEIKEAMVQLYAYCGFPRSLNGINIFRKVLDERHAKGKKDNLGKEIEVENKTVDKYEQGRNVLEYLTQTPQSKPAPGFGEFAPRIDVFLKEHLFADIFNSDVLSFQQRELVTIAALASMNGVAPQLQAHIGMGMNTGITIHQIQETFDLIEKHIGKDQAETSREVLSQTVRN